MRAPPGRQRWLAVALALFALAVGLTLFRLTRWSSAAGFSLKAEWAMFDFRASVYYPAVAFLNGDNPYDHEQFLAHYPMEGAFPVYPPAILLVHLPFGLMSYAHAVAAFYLYTIALTVVVAFMAVRMNGLPESAALVLTVASVMILSRPGHMNLLLGQDTLLYIIGTYLAIDCAETSPGWSGLGVSLAFLKPTLGFPLVLLMLVQKRFRAILHATGIGALMNLPPLLILIYNSGGVAPFLHSLVSNFRARGHDPGVNPLTSPGNLNVHVSGVVSRLADRPLGTVGEATILLVVLGVAAVALRVLIEQNGREARALATTVVALAALTGIHHQPYDLLLLTLPCVALLGRRFPAAFYAPRLYWSLVVLLAVLAFNYVATFSGVAALGLSGLPLRLVIEVNPIALLALFVLVVTTLIVKRRPIVAELASRSGS
jgi:hypothetical protein